MLSYGVTGGKPSSSMIRIGRASTFFSRKGSNDLAAELSEEGFEVRGNDEEIVGRTLLNCSIATLTP